MCLSFFKKLITPNEDPLALLRQIVLSLQGKKFDEKGNSGADQMRFDPEGGALEDFSLKDQDASVPIDPIKSNEVKDALMPSFRSFYVYLLKSKNSYLTWHLTRVAHTANALVRSIDQYQTTKSEDTLNAILKAKQDFRNACKLIQKQNLILIGLVGAILGGIAGFLAAPFLLPAIAIGAKIALTSTAGTAIALGLTLLKPSHEKYHKIEAKIDELLPADPLSSGTKIRSSNINYVDRLQVKHTNLDGTEPDLEDGFEPKKGSSFLNCCAR